MNSDVPVITISKEVLDSIELPSSVKDYLMDTGLPSGLFLRGVNQNLPPLSVNKFTGKKLVSSYSRFRIIGDYTPITTMCMDETGQIACIIHREELIIHFANTSPKHFIKSVFAYENCNSEIIEIEGREEFDDEAVVKVLDIFQEELQSIDPAIFQNESSFWKQILYEAYLCYGIDEE